MNRIWLLGLALGAGCVDLKSAYPDKRFYTIQAERPGPGRPGADASVLRVRRFSASRLAEGNELVSRTGDAEYESDFYSVFFVPPAIQVTEEARRWLGRSKLFGTVVGSGSAVPETHVLEGHLVALYGDRRQAGAFRAVLEVQVLLVAVSVEPPAVLFDRTYRQEIAPSGDDAPSLVRGWGEGLSKILTLLEEDLSKIERTPRK